MPTYRIQTSLQDVSGLPRDRYVTSLYAASASAADDDALSVMAQAGRGFFDGPLASYLSYAMGDAGHTTKVYLVGAPLGSPPKFDLSWTFVAQRNPTGAKSLPNEVACCLTFHADPQVSVPNAEHGEPYVPGVHRQSWRGRIYAGPLNATTMGGSGGGTGRPDLTFTNTLLGAGATFNDALNPVGHASGLKWVILSKKQAKIYPVARLSVDDAWDTQRSRGLRASTVIQGAQDIGGGPSGPIG